MTRVRKKGAALTAPPRVDGTAEWALAQGIENPR